MLNKMNRCNASVVRIGLAGAVLLSSMGLMGCGGGRDCVRFDPAKAWKYEVDILTSKQFSPGLMMVQDLLHVDEENRLWLLLTMCFEGQSDAYAPVMEHRILISEDYGLTWELTEKAFPRDWPGELCHRVDFGDGTIAQAGDGSGQVTLEGRTFQLNHQYGFAQKKAFKIVTTVEDDDGASDTHRGNKLIVTGTLEGDTITIKYGSVIVEVFPDLPK